MTRTKPILRWPGGKTRLLKTLLPLIRPHACYVEPFAGGLAVLLAKDPAKAEIVNDINNDIVTLYRCAKFHLEPLITELQWVLNARQNLQDFVKQPGLTDIQRSARFLLRNRISFGGSGTSYGVSRTNSGACTSREAVIAALEAFSQRLDRVSVENVSWERVLRTYDGPQSLFFMDPPYMGGETKNYAAWQESDMRAFASAVMQLQGDWLITVNDCPLTRELFAGHELKPVITASGAVNRKSRPSATFRELIIRRRISNQRRKLSTTATVLA